MSRKKLAEKGMVHAGGEVHVPSRVGVMGKRRKTPVKALKDFLAKCCGPKEEVFVYTFARGTRVAEISFVCGSAGYSFMRSEPEHANVVLSAEDFLWAAGRKRLRGEPDWLEEAGDRLRSAVME